MRFRARMELWLEVDDLDTAMGATTTMETAALEALGPLAIPDPADGGLSRTDLEPMDDAAFAALEADDLGPGISSVRFSYELDDTDD
jgi:hypothetical protein